MMGQAWTMRLLLVLELLLLTVAKKPRILVILDALEIRQTHGLFFSDLEKSGYGLTFKVAGDKTMVLERYGEGQYDHLIIFAPTAPSWGKKIGPGEVVDFADGGKSVLMVGAPGMTKQVFNLAAEFGVDFEKPRSMATDHVHHARLMQQNRWTDDHELLVVEPESVVQDVFSRAGSRFDAAASLLFKGVGHSVAPEAEQVTIGVAGHATTYSHSKAAADDAKSLRGRDVSLVSLIQLRNNARVTVVGSLEFFGDALFTERFIPSRSHRSEGITSGNRQFALHLVQWTFQSLGVLRNRPPRHYHRMTGRTQSMYTVRDPVLFEVDIEEYVVDKWVPYKADDIQLEYFMMFPYIRTSLKDNSNGTFSVDLMAPDVYGVFKFLIDYQRPGYSRIDITEMAPIRPFRHNEYERFIPTAYPYYTSVMSMMIGFWVLGIVFLYHR